MTAWKDLDVIPREVIKYLENLKCPICKARISIDEPDCAALYLRDEFILWSNCAKDRSHYEINLEWEDTKLIHCVEEQICFQYLDREYQITKIHKDFLSDRNSANDLIKIYQLDELGHPDDEKFQYLMFDKEYFNFKKFNAKKFANLIKTLAIFK